MSKQKVRGLSGGKDAQALQKEIREMYSGFINDAHEDRDLYRTLCEVLIKRLQSSNTILRYVEKHGSLPIGGEQFPNSECVYECAEDNTVVINKAFEVLHGKERKKD